MKGKAIIFSAPSGSGKTTIVRHLLKKLPYLDFSISATSRLPRGTEVHGKDYYFISPEDFKKKIENKEFAEYEEVYGGDFYGTLQSEIERIWASGKHVIFDVDVKGGLNLKKHFGENALAIFVKVPDLKTLEERLRKRATDSDEKIRRRLEKAQYEIGYAKDFDIQLENFEEDKALLQAEKLVDDFVNKRVVR
mgnify:CR=1 FL=1